MYIYIRAVNTARAKAKGEQAIQFSFFALSSYFDEVRRSMNPKVGEPEGWSKDPNSWVHMCAPRLTVHSSRRVRY